MKASSRELARLDFSTGASPATRPVTVSSDPGHSKPGLTDPRPTEAESTETGVVEIEAAEVTHSGASCLNNRQWEPASAVAKPSPVKH